MTPVEFEELVKTAQAGDAMAFAVIRDWLLERGADEAAVRAFIRRLFAAPNLSPSRYWDAVELAERIQGGARYEFFRELSGKTLDQTNMVMPRRLPSGSTFALERVRAEVLGDVVPRHLLDVSTFAFRVNNRRPWVIPLRTLVEAGLHGAPVAHWPSLRDNDDIHGWVEVHQGLVLAYPLRVVVYLEGTERGDGVR